MADHAAFESKILIIDDSWDNIEIIRRFLNWAGYRNVAAEADAPKALEEFRSHDPDLVILDLHMPKLSGFEVLERIREIVAESEFIPVLVLTADTTREARKRALELGATDFVTQPGDPTEILLRVQNFLKARRLHLALEEQKQHLEQRVVERTRDLEDARLETLECLAKACEYRDDATGQHTQRVGELSASIAKELGLRKNTVEYIRQAAPLHDIGKLGIPDAILLKPGRLTPMEFEEMKHHVFIGSSILSRSKSPVLRMAREIALCHHERWDGKGYMHGLSEGSIPITARIVSVADAFDAMTSARPYHSAKSADDARGEIHRGSGTQFDPAVVKAFEEVVSRGLHSEARR